MDLNKKRQKEDELLSSLLTSARAVIAQAEELEKVTGSNLHECGNTRQAQWLSLKSPETDLSWYKQHCSDSEPIELWGLSPLLGNLFQNVAHGTVQMKGLVALQDKDQVDFCISGSFSARELQMFFARQQEHPSDENKK